MSLLVVGANGLLGSNVVATGLRNDRDVCGTYHSTEPEFEVSLRQFDLREHASFDDVLDEYSPGAVVNCAAMTDVDGCETDPELAHVLNGEAPGALADQCAERGIDFVHVSTDYVFDGETAERYPESATVNPVQAYGESKLAGEQSVRSAPGDSLTVRLSFVWGVHRGTGDLTGFPAWVRRRLDAGEDVPLFTDQRVTPTRAGQAAETLLTLLDRGSTGRFHVACTSCVTPYEFGEVLAEHVGSGDATLVEGSMDDVDRAATRPRNTCLDVGKVETELGREQPTLREDVDAAWSAL
jgi:dTDP-4-dehydrorhamnose reductase